MKILITGAKGFVGKNLAENLKNIRDGKNKTSGITVDEVFEYDIDTPFELLEEYCRKADFVFNLAGVNRPKENSEFMTGNFGFAEILLNTLKKYENKCPVMLASSTQATRNNDYGRSKSAGEHLFGKYGNETGAPVYIYRFPNVFGKWCRPNYNSAVATFCNNIANDLPITVNDRSTELELLYIDDLIDEMINALKGNPTRCEYFRLNPGLPDGSFAYAPVPKADGNYCYCPVTHFVTLGKIVDTLETFKAQPQNLVIPEIPYNSFEKKLYSTYLSYLPKEKTAFMLKMNTDIRGSFTELIKSKNVGQVSVNISKPGITKGEHWHNTKWEFFIVVSGHGLIRERKIGTDEIMEFEVSGDKIQAIHMLPGYTHNIINLSDTENLVTVMWANEEFNPEKPDTFFEKV